MTLVIRHANYGGEMRLKVMFYKVPDEVLPTSSVVPSTREVVAAVDQGEKISYDDMAARHPHVAHHVFFGYSMLGLVEALGQPFILWKTGHGPIDHPVEVLLVAEDMQLSNSHLRLPKRALRTLQWARPDMEVLGDLLRLTPAEVNAIWGLGKRSKSYRHLVAALSDHGKVLAS